MNNYPAFRTPCYFPSIEAEMLVVTILSLLIVHTFAEQQQISKSSSLKTSDGLRHVTTYDVRRAGGGSNRTGNKYAERSNASADFTTLLRSQAAVEAAPIPRSPATRARRKRRRVKHDVNPEPTIINPGPAIINPEPAIINPGPAIINPEPAIVKQSANEGKTIFASTNKCG